MSKIAHDYKTYDQWINNGRVVRKGEKASRKSPLGHALFHRDQTRALEYSHDGGDGDYDYDGDQMDSGMMYFPIMGQDY